MNNHGLIILLALLFATRPVTADAETPTWQRLTMPVARVSLDGNIQQLYEIEKAAWIWAEGADDAEKLILEFGNAFEVAEATEVAVHVTADQWMTLSDGKDASVCVAWAGSLYELAADGKMSRTKGSRNEVVNKAFRGGSGYFY